MAPDYESIYDDMGEPFAAAYSRTSPFTMTSRERMYALWQAADYIAQAQVVEGISILLHRIDHTGRIAVKLSG
jgi:hypothetical protein